MAFALQWSFPIGESPIRVLPGQYYDAETGTHYNYFRDYDPSVGRYEQSDPLGLQGGINTYIYGGANPLRNIDPSGRNWAIPAVIGIGIVWGVCEFYDCAKGLLAYNDGKRKCLSECGDPADPRTNIFDYLKCLTKYTPLGSEPNDALSLHYCTCAKLGGLAKCRELRDKCGTVATGSWW